MLTEYWIHHQIEIKLKIHKVKRISFNLVFKAEVCDFWLLWSQLSYFYVRYREVCGHVCRHENKIRAHGYPPKPTPIWRVFPDLTGFGYGFGLSPTSKYGYGTGNRDTCTHPELIPKPYPNVEKSFFFCFCWGGW